ncbi:MAG: SDR family oxidoreductase [Acidimicrobiia bacterium]|nr:MAG: SDR family oxidoreductase [Acidimicrobiia bacterium]
MDLGLAGKVALVAAASRGLGEAIARTLAEEGCTVEICSRSLDRAQRTAETISASTGQAVIGSEVDVTDGDAISAWVNEAARRHGGLDIVIPNAGGPRHGSFADTMPEDWDTAYRLTLRSAMAFAAASKRHLDAGGSMLYLTSSSVKEPISSLVLSNVFRAGVAALAKTLASDWAGDGIRVNQLIPGRIATERLAELDAYVAELRGATPDDVSRASRAAIPLGRYGVPDEFASAAVFLVSPAASFITGATLAVDGGALKSIF